MQKTEENRIRLFIIFSVTVVVSNIISAKILWTPFRVFDMPMQLPGSAFVYLLTFMISGLINEIWGKEAAKQCVKFGLMSQILALTLFWLTGLLPAVDPDFQFAYNTVLGRNFVFVASDIVAGFTAQFGNVFLFPLLKKLKPKGNLKSKPKNSGLINCISILISQLFDTAIFMTAAFGIGLGYLFTQDGRESLFTMFVGQYLIKIVVCVASIPFFNLVTRQSKSLSTLEEEKDVNVRKS